VRGAPGPEGYRCTMKLNVGLRKNASLVSLASLGGNIPNPFVPIENRSGGYSNHFKRTGKRNLNINHPGCLAPQCNLPNLWKEERVNLPRPLMGN